MFVCQHWDIKFSTNSHQAIQMRAVNSFPTTQIQNGVQGKFTYGFNREYQPTGHERQSRQHCAELTTFKLAESFSLSLWSHCNWHSHMAAATPVILILGVWAVWAILEKRQTERDRQRLFHSPGSMKDPPNVAWRDDFWKKTTKKRYEFPPESEHKLPQRVGGHCGYKWRFLWAATFRVNPCGIAIGQCCERNVLSLFRDKQDYK